MEVECIVVGAGVVGLAVARALACAGKEVLVLERNSLIGQETSSRSSEVIHAGIYYPRDSLKAKLCVEGKQKLYHYCASRNIEHQKVGKLIVAAKAAQEDALEDLYRKGLDNGVEDLSFISATELEKLEPNLRATKAILSPSTGIVDSHQLMLSFQADLEEAGGIVATKNEVLSVQALGTGFELEVLGDDVTRVRCENLVIAAGLGTQTVCERFSGLDAELIPRLYLSKGCYFSLSGSSPFRHLIYPIPDNEGLGVHLTLDIGGVARFGPDTEWVNTENYDVPVSKLESFYSAISQYYPDIYARTLQPAYAGIRPKIAGPGQQPADFMIQSSATHGIEGLVLLYGIESPGLTSSMAVADRVLSAL